MTDAEKLEGIANFLDIQGSPALALSLRQIASRSRKIDEVIQSIAAILEPDLDSEPRAAIDCKQIIADYLKANGFDGLCDDGCGCGLDNLCPCAESGGNPLDCQPAYAAKSKCIDCRIVKNCPAAEEDEDGEVRACYTDIEPREREGRLFRSDVGNAGERPA